MQSWAAYSQKIVNYYGSLCISHIHIYRTDYSFLRRREGRAASWQVLQKDHGTNRCIPQAESKLTCLNDISAPQNSYCCSNSQIIISSCKIRGKSSGLRESLPCMWNGNSENCRVLLASQCLRSTPCPEVWEKQCRCPKIFPALFWCILLMLIPKKLNLMPTIYVSLSYMKFLIKKILWRKCWNSPDRNGKTTQDYSTPMPCWCLKMEMER